MVGDDQLFKYAQSKEVSRDTEVVWQPGRPGQIKTAVPPACFVNQRFKVL